MKGTLTAAPAHNGEPDIAPVLMVFIGAEQLTVVVLIPGPKIVILVLLQFKLSGVAEAQSVFELYGFVVVVNVPV